MVAIGYSPASSTTPTHTFSWDPSPDDVLSLHMTLDCSRGLDPEREALDPNDLEGAAEEAAQVLPETFFDRTITVRIDHDLAEKLTTIAESCRVPKSDLVRAFLHSEVHQYGRFARVEQVAA
jgi:N12 class adenine-specific DNA methylase